jgi:hypothetical protein
MACLGSAYYRGVQGKTGDAHREDDLVTLGTPRGSAGIDPEGIWNPAKVKSLYC